jgi:hypothetical protein
MELTKDQINFIEKDLQERGLNRKNIFSEMLDHVCSAVEDKMTEGKDFNSAYQEVILSFKKNEFENLGADIQKAKDLFIYVDETLTPKNTFFKKKKDGMELIALRRNLYLSGVLSLFFLITAALSVLLLKSASPMFFVMLAASCISLLGLINNFFGQSMVTIENDRIKVFESRFPRNYKKIFSKRDINKLFIENSKMEMGLRGASSTASIDSIVIQTAEKIKFGKSLSPEQRYYLLNVLKRNI